MSNSPRPNPYALPTSASASPSVMPQSPATTSASTPAPGSGAFAARRYVLALLAGVGAAVLSAGLFYVLTWHAGLQLLVAYLPIGPIVGAAVRFAGGGRATTGGKAYRLTACVLAVLACLGGYVAFDVASWSPFMLKATVGRTLDLLAILLYALAGYVAWIIAARES